MVRNIIIGIVIFFSCHFDLVAQDSNKYFSVGLIPTYYFDPITPSIGVSFEHSIAKNINCEIMYGFDPNWKFLNWHRDPFSIHHEYKLKLIYLFRGENQTNRFTYLGVDYFGNYNKYNRENDSYYEDDLLYEYDMAEVIRAVNGLRINYGIKTKLVNRIWADVFMGSGIRTVVVRYFPENKTESDNRPFDEWFVPFDRNAGEKSKVALIFGLKIAYRFY